MRSRGSPSRPTTSIVNMNEPAESQTGRQPTDQPDTASSPGKHRRITRQQLFEFPAAPEMPHESCRRQIAAQNFRQDGPTGWTDRDQSCPSTNVSLMTVSLKLMAGAPLSIMSPPGGLL